MTSLRSSQNNQGTPDPDIIKAARKYVQEYPEDAIKYLVAECNPIQLLREACDFKGQDYHEIMSQNLVPEDDTKSQSSRRRTLSSNSRSGLASSSSAILSSAGSGDSSPVTRTLWVMPESGPEIPKTLQAICLPRSDCLIQNDTVRDHLMLEHDCLSDGELVRSVRYNGGFLESYGKISFDWALSHKDLEAEKVQRSTFYVVEELPGGKVVLSDSDPQHSPVHRAGGMSPL
jgi:hypothetical protein